LRPNNRQRRTNLGVDALRPATLRSHDGKVATLLGGDGNVVTFSASSPVRLLLCACGFSLRCVAWEYARSHWQLAQHTRRVEAKIATDRRDFVSGHVAAQNATSGQNDLIGWCGHGASPLRDGVPRLAALALDDLQAVAVPVAVAGVPLVREQPLPWSAAPSSEVVEFFATRAVRPACQLQDVHDLAARAVAALRGLRCFRLLRLRLGLRGLRRLLLALRVEVAHALAALGDGRSRRGIDLLRHRRCDALGLLGHGILLLKAPGLALARTLL